MKINFVRLSISISLLIGSIIMATFPSDTLNINARGILAMRV
jgi:hypothetical protein